jgi:hypothetical protein
MLVRRAKDVKAILGTKFLGTVNVFLDFEFC